MGNNSRALSNSLNRVSKRSQRNSSQRTSQIIISQNRTQSRSGQNGPSSLRRDTRRSSGSRWRERRRSERIQNQALLREDILPNPDIPGPSFAGLPTTQQHQPRPQPSRSSEAQPNTSQRNSGIFQCYFATKTLFFKVLIRHE